jgi:uncharacterized membrane protein
MICKYCAAEISTEQHDKYFNRCPDCYGDYKKLMAKQSLVPGCIFFMLGLLYLVLFSVLGSLSYGMRLSLGFFHMFAGTIWFQTAWRWAYTEVLPWRYDKKRSILSVTTVLPMMIMLIIALIFSMSA